jgi:hypothetical protein
MALRANALPARYLLGNRFVWRCTIPVALSYPADLTSAGMDKPARAALQKAARLAGYRQRAMNDLAQVREAALDCG